MSYILAFAALAAFMMVLLIWWAARSYGPLKRTGKLKKTHGLSLPAARSVAGQTSPTKPIKFGKR